MSNYIVTDTELTSIADTIRTKSGQSESLSFPNGFISGIESISGGGGTSVVKVDFTYTNNGNTETWTLDKTFNEIDEEFKKGNIVMIRETNGTWYQAVRVVGNARVLRYITTGGSSSSPTIVCKTYSYSGSGGVDDYPSCSYTISDN